MAIRVANSASVNPACAGKKGVQRVFLPTAEGAVAAHASPTASSFFKPLAHASSVVNLDGSYGRLLWLASQLPKKHTLSMQVC